MASHEMKLIDAVGYLKSGRIVSDQTVNENSITLCYACSSKLRV